MNKINNGSNSTTRLEYLRTYFRYSQSEFAKVLGITQSTYAHMVSKAKGLTMSHIETIAQELDINPTWLITGTGQMLLSDYKKQFKESNSNLLIPFSAQAGYTKMAESHEENGQFEFVKIPGVYGNARTFQIYGDSMEPTLYDGDYVSGTKVEDLRDITPSGIYVFVLHSGVFIKQAILTTSNLRLISVNKNHTHFNVNLDEIIEIWKADIKITTKLSTATEESERVLKMYEFLIQKFPDFT